MEEIRIDCPAKINLFLEILSKRTDGYHEVITVMQTIDMHDRLLFREKKSGISIRCRETSVPTDENNLVFKTAQLLLNETGARRGVEVEIQKKIPVLIKRVNYITAFFQHLFHVFYSSIERYFIVCHLGIFYEKFY